MGGKILLWWGSPQKIGRNSGKQLLTKIIIPNLEIPNSNVT
jgi:hypothetical protein